MWIPASYKSDRYARWKEKSKLAHQMEENDDNDGGAEEENNNFKGKRGKKGNKTN